MEGISKKIFSCICVVLLFLNSCSHKTASYEEDIQNYSCLELESERKFQIKIISELTDGKKELNIAEDLAIGFLTLGMANINSDRSNFTNKNYDKVISEANNKLTVLRPKLKECK